MRRNVNLMDDEAAWQGWIRRRRGGGMEGGGRKKRGDTVWVRGSICRGDYSRMGIE